MNKYIVGTRCDNVYGEAENNPDITIFITLYNASSIIVTNLKDYTDFFGANQGYISDVPLMFPEPTSTPGSSEHVEFPLNNTSYPCGCIEVCYGEEEEDWKEYTIHVMQGTWSNDPSGVFELEYHMVVMDEDTGEIDNEVLLVKTSSGEFRLHLGNRTYNFGIFPVEYYVASLSGGSDAVNVDTGWNTSDGYKVPSDAQYEEDDNVLNTSTSLGAVPGYRP